MEESVRAFSHYCNYQNMDFYNILLLFKCCCWGIHQLNFLVWRGGTKSTHISCGCQRALGGLAGKKKKSMLGASRLAYELKNTKLRALRLLSSFIVPAKLFGSLQITWQLIFYTGSSTVMIKFWFDNRIPSRTPDNLADANWFGGHHIICGEIQIQL